MTFESRATSDESLLRRLLRHRLATTMFFQVFQCLSDPVSFTNHERPATSHLPLYTNATALVRPSTAKDPVSWPALFHVFSRFFLAQSSVLGPQSSKAILIQLPVQRPPGNPQLLRSDGFVAVRLSEDAGYEFAFHVVDFFGLSGSPIAVFSRC